MKVAVIGAGWAGMAAAIAHTQAGHQITVFEAARTVGGRARAVPGTLPDGSPVTLDNGQHILIGAYATSLRLMRLVGVDTDSALLRLPLTLQFPDGQGLQLPDLPPPLDALLGIARAKGWHWRDKLALLRTATGWQLRGFRCAPQTSVAELCAALTPRLMAEFIDPLCVSALNTPACEASGQVFLRVLQDSLFSGRGGSNLLLPRTDLGALFPEAAMRWLVQQGGQVVTGQRIQRLVPLPSGRWQLAGTPERISTAGELMAPPESTKCRAVMVVRTASAATAPLSCTPTQRSACTLPEARSSFSARVCTSSVAPLSSAAGMVVTSMDCLALVGQPMPQEPRFQQPCTLRRIDSTGMPSLTAPERSSSLFSLGGTCHDDTLSLRSACSKYGSSACSL